MFIKKIFVFFLFFLFSLQAFAKYISYTDSGEGKPLVLIHAFPSDERLWLKQREELKHYFRVITLDLWGFGQSEKTEAQAITMKEYADEIKQLLDQLHINKAVIGGESMGGYITLAFLQYYPEKSMGMILSNTQSIADTDEIKKKRESIAQMILTEGSTKFLDDFMTKALSSDVSLEIRQELREILHSQTVTGIASALRGMALREDTSSVLAKTILPVLIITSDHDALVSPEQSYRMLELAKNSKLINIKNTGHLSSLEQPKIWNKAVIDMFYY